MWDDDTAEPADSTTTSLTTTTADLTTASSSTTAPGSDTTGDTTGDTADGDGCWVHLFEDDDFQEDDDHFRLAEPGRYSDLGNLPGATDDWTDEAESIRVGPDATVTIWSDTDFEGEWIELGPGSEQADLDDEPESLELLCD